MFLRSASRLWRAARPALATASGQAAETLTLTTLASAGEEIVSTTSLYGGTYNLFHYTFPRLGITVRFVDADDFDGLRAAINDKTRAIYTETLGNPKLDVVDIERIAAIAHEHKLPLVIDNTSASAGAGAAHRVGRGHRGQLRHQVSGRPRHHHRRRDRGCGQVRLGGFWAIQGLCRAGPLLSRPFLHRGLRSAGVHSQGARAGVARHRRGSLALQRLPAAAGH